MAIYSLRLAPIGKTTQKRAFTAAAHIRYITRKEAVSQGRASWFAAIHAKGKDRLNPHCHLLVRDRDVRDGRRVVMFSAGQKEAAQRAAKGQPGPTTLRMIREMWARHANGALERAGRSERIDHRRLVDQGLFKRAQVHEGPNIRAMHDRGVRPTSRDRVIRNPALRKKGSPKTRTVRFEEIDRGRTRVEYNLALKEAPELTLTQMHALRLRMSQSQASTAWTPSRGRTR